MGKEKVGTDDSKNHYMCDRGDTQKNYECMSKVAYHYNSTL